MASLKVRSLLFDGWWREHVVLEPGARVAFADLYRSYTRAVEGAMGRQTFVARLNELRIGEEKEKGVRYRTGIRLLEEAPSVALRAPPPPPSARGDDPVMRGVRSKPIVETYAPARPLGDDDGVYRLAPYAGGPSVRCVVLEAEGDEDFASALFARAVFRARVRQRRSVEEGGEGYSNDRDDRYAGDLARAAAAYAYAAAQPDDFRTFLELNAKPVRASSFGWPVLDMARRLWPWEREWWKPKTRQADLTRAGALILAELERLARAEARGRLTADESRLATGV